MANSLSQFIASRLIDPAVERRLASTVQKNTQAFAVGVLPQPNLTLRETLGQYPDADYDLLYRTRNETSLETQQHEHAQIVDVVVAGNSTMGEGGIAHRADASAGGLAELLTRRGITGTTAHELAVRWPERVLSQVEMYDWLREGDGTDPRYHPGRLRRMIEEGWAPPPGFLSRAEREARRATRRRAAARGGIAAQGDPPDAAESRDALARQLGVREADQGVWQALIGSPPGFPPFMRQALFCPPPAGTRTAAVIFPDERVCARGGVAPGGQGSPRDAHRGALSYPVRGGRFLHPDGAARATGGGGCVSALSTTSLPE